LLKNVSLSTKIKLVDLPDTVGPQTYPTIARGVLSQRTADTVRAVWPTSGLTLIEKRSVAPALKTSQLQSLASSKPIDCDGLTGVRQNLSDAPLNVSFPETVCVEPGSALSIDISARILPGYEAEYAITQLQLEETDFGATWDRPSGDSDTQGKGVLRWTPQEQHVDPELRPYTAHFIALAKQRDAYCGGIGIITWCDTKRIKFEVRIVVTWGSLPTPKQHSFSGSSAEMTIEGEAGVNFQPRVEVQADISSGWLDYARVAVAGPISFKSKVRLAATAQAHFEYSRELVDKRFIKVFWPGGVPVVINGRLILRLEAQGTADAALDLEELLEIGYELEAGLEYKDGAWKTLKKAQPWQHFELSGEANAHGYVELRFVPDIEISFYDTATGRLIIEPYVYGKAGVEGHFLYRVLADGSGVQEGSDTDYRFTQLEFGGGVDAKFRAGIEVLDKSIVGYPKDVTQFEEFPLIEQTAFIGLPQLQPALSGEGSASNCQAVGLTAAVTNVLNPFQGFFGGADSFNPFADESAAWQVVMPSGTEQLVKGAGPRDAWFSAATSGLYTLRFSGHSGLGSFIRQYEDFQFNYDASANHCVQAGRLNDTGIDWCANETQNFLACPVANYPWQDAQDGRDKTNNDDSDGHAGFSFTKLDVNGNPLAAGAATWSCVRDNVTGLIWEVKTDDGGLRDKDWTYTWYNSDAATNGGSAGTADGGNNCFNTARCDTQKYVADVNAQGFCGAHDWRLPDPRELLSIVSNDRINPAIDTTYFPNTVASWVWSASPYAYDPNYAWYVYFSGGGVDADGKNYAGSVRLVRGRQ